MTTRNCVCKCVGLTDRVFCFIRQAIVELVLEHHFGQGSYAVRLTKAWVGLKTWASDNKISLTHPKFTRARLQWENNSQYPALKSKAYNARVMVVWMAHVTHDNVARSSPPNEKQIYRHALFANLAKFCQHLDEYPHLLSSEQASNLKSDLDNVLDCYTHLATMALAASQCFYAFKPKFHQLEHVAEDVIIDELNPAWHWNFIDEDMMGKVKRMALRPFWPINK